jgi:transposase
MDTSQHRLLARIAPLLPSLVRQRGWRWREHRQVINGIVFRVRTGVPWRDVPERYGPWKTLYKRFARWQEDGTWARIVATRYDKLAFRYRATVQVADILIWLRAKPDRPTP